jgi:hypothetical protein
MNGCVRSLRRAVRDFCEDAGISLKTFIRLYMDDFKYYTWNPDATANAWEEHMVFDTPEQALETWAATGIDNEDPTPVNNFAGEGAETIPDLPKRSPTGEPLY